MIGKLADITLNTLLETIPIEFSVVDASGNVLAWNKHDTRIFKRHTGIVGKNVKNCHPKKSLEKVEKILQEMKDGIRDKARFWIDLPIGENNEKNKVLIEYYALRDSDGKYLGCLEASQNISEIKKLEGIKRLLD